MFFHHMIMIIIILVIIMVIIVVIIVILHIYIYTYGTTVRTAEFQAGQTHGAPLLPQSL